MSTCKCSLHGHRCRCMLLHVCNAQRHCQALEGLLFGVCSVTCSFDNGMQHRAYNDMTRHKHCVPGTVQCMFAGQRTRAHEAYACM